ncbi:hypothetical protein [Lactococcus lactis]|uniref:hypothetical protein n=1 Tax=Lactococcus lactis TaxID=1358 RepID=UPI003A810C17
MEIRYFFDEVKETAINIKKPIFADKDLYNKFIENSKNVIAIDITSNYTLLNYLHKSRPKIKQKHCNTMKKFPKN